MRGRKSDKNRHRFVANFESRLRDKSKVRGRVVRRSVGLKTQANPPVKSEKNLRRRKFRVQERESLKSLNIRLFHRELSLKRKCKAAATVFNRFTNENGISQLAIER